jgi:hypothetical protein
VAAAENDILKVYLAEIARVRATGAGTSETSHYGALQGALNAVGDTLSPRVYCLSQMSGAAGFPDFGLFTELQFARGGEAAVWVAGGPVAERGVVEADDIPAPFLSSAVLRRSRIISVLTAWYSSQTIVISS